MLWGVTWALGTLTQHVAEVGTTATTLVPTENFNMLHLSTFVANRAAPQKRITPGNACYSHIDCGSSHSPEATNRGTVWALTA